MKPFIHAAYNATLEQAQRLTADVPDERFAELPHPGAKHPGWVLQHLCLASGMGAAVLAEPDNPTIGLGGVPVEWAAAASPGQPVVGDRMAFAPKDTLLAEFARVHAALSERFLASPDSVLEQPFPNPEYRAFFPTIGQGIFYLMTHHEPYHLGQLAAWRRAVGYPGLDET